MQTYPPHIEALKHVALVSPAHYKSNSLECITVIEAFNLSFCLGNTIKYILRHGRKEGSDPLLDLKKARWYLDRAIINMESGRARNPS